MSFTYRGLKATLETYTVTEEEIERNLQRLQQQNPRIALVTDRPTQLGDEIVLDYAGYCDGQQFAGGTAENQTLVLGSGMFIPGFEEQLVDKVVEEKVIVTVTFPKEYHAENLAGKEAQFHCTIHQIRVKTPYELDDVFAKEVGQCENMAEMRQKLGKSLQDYANQRGEMDLQDRLLRQAASTLEGELSAEALEVAVEEQMRNMQAQLAQQGLSLEMYCQFMNTTEEQLRAEAVPAAENAMRCQAAVGKIVALEHLSANDQEIANALAGVCRQNNMTLEQLKPFYDAEFEEAIINSILTGKVMALIREAADITVI